MIYHPDSGLHYVHVFPEIKIFEEIRNCYVAASGRLGWMSVGLPDWNRSDLAIILWGTLPEVPDDRKAIAAYRHLESIGTPGDLEENQRHILEQTLPRLNQVDIVFSGNPAGAKLLEPFCRKSAYAPIGYDPQVMGRPDWTQPKHADLVFYGTPTERRAPILSEIERRKRIKFSRIYGYGSMRKELMDRSKAVLFIGHSQEPGFPGMRLWQTIATSAALITEKRDAWPAIAGLHYIEVNWDGQSKEQFADAVQYSLMQPLEAMARKAHEDLAAFTVERCMQAFVVPPIEEVR